MQEIVAFTIALFRHWVLLMTGSAFIVGLNMWERRQGQHIPLSVYFVIAFVFVLIAAFLTWRDTNRELVPLKDRKRKADVLGKLLVEAHTRWVKGCQAKTQADSDQWHKEYAEWLAGIKGRVESEVDPNEAPVIFQITDIRDAPPVDGLATQELGARMGYLKLHIIGLKEALKRYLPSDGK